LKANIFILILHQGIYAGLITKLLLLQHTDDIILGSTSAMHNPGSS